MADQVLRTTSLTFSGSDPLWVGSGRSANVIRREFFGSDPNEEGRILVRTANGWKPKPVKYWDGTQWVLRPLKRWDGANWVLTLI